MCPKIPAYTVIVNGIILNNLKKGEQGIIKILPHDSSAFTL